MFRHHQRKPFRMCSLQVPAPPARSFFLGHGAAVAKPIQGAQFSRVRGWIRKAANEAAQAM